MLLKVFKDINNFDEFNFDSCYIQEMLSLIKLSHGSVYTDNIVLKKHAFVLYQEGKEPVILTEDVIFSKLPEEYQLLILPEIGGDIPVPFILIAMLAGATGLSLAAAGFILAVVGTILIAGALMAGVMAFLTPTAQFDKDPSSSQNKKSSLFNNTPVIREQGGIVPLIYGNPYCSGVLISSGLSTFDIDI
jgi:hypothetical protein